MKRARCILVVDEHEMSREALALMLGRAFPRYAVFDLPPARLGAEPRHPALCSILYHLRPPLLTSMNILQQLRASYPDVPLVVLSDASDERVAQMVRGRGADGLFHTRGAADELLAMIRHLMKGKPAFPVQPPSLFQRQDYRFTPRQAEVLHQLCQGLSNKEIGTALGLSEHTVRTHVSAIFNILGARNRTEAVMVGRRLIHHNLE